MLPQLQERGLGWWATLGCLPQPCPPGKLLGLCSKLLKVLMQYISELKQDGFYLGRIELSRSL